MRAMRTRRLASSAVIALFFFVLFGHGYFYNGTGWAMNARFDPIYAFVEPGHKGSYSFRINRFIKKPEGGVNTGDWAFFDGNYFSNKAPGTAFLGIPVYWALFHGERILGVDPLEPRWVIANNYLINLVLSVLFTAVSVVLLFRFLVGELEFSQRLALLGAFLYAFCTLIFPFNTQFTGHTTAAALILIGYIVLWRLPLRAGFCLALAAISDYMAAIALVLAIGALDLRQAARFVLGAAGPLAALAIYNKTCFGSVWALSVQFSNPWVIPKGFNESFLSFFDGQLAERFLKLLFSLERGFFTHMPVLALALPGTVWLWKRERRVAVLCVVNIVVVLAAVSAMKVYHGGSSTGARYMTVALPFWGVLMACGAYTVWESSAKRALVVGLAALSFFNMFSISAVNPMLAHDTPNPVYGKTYGDLVSGNLHSNDYSAIHERALKKPEEKRNLAFNLWTLVMEGKNHLSLVPWLLVMSMALNRLFSVKGSAADRRGQGAKQ